MPDKNIDLKTEFDYYSNVLIIDELGGISSLLVDALLNHGCLVYYLGKENKDTFYYLSEKSNFVFLNSYSEIEKINKLSYLYYFPAENGSKLSRAEDILWLTEKYFCKSMICYPVDEIDSEKYLLLTKEKDRNLRIVAFEDIFGPRVQSGVLSKIFKTGIWERKESVIENSKREVSPVFVKSLVKELVKMIFMPETKSRTYLIKGEETTLENFVKKIIDLDSSFHLKLLKEEQEIKKETSSLEEVFIEGNLEEEIEETINWFKKNIPIEEKNEAKETPPLIPVFETEVKNELPKEGKENIGFLFEERKEERKEEKKKEKKQKIKKKATFLKKMFLGIFISFLLIFFSFLAPILLTGAFGVLGIKAIQKSKEAIDLGNFSSAIQLNERGDKLLNSAQKIVLIASPFYSLMGFDKQVEIINETLLFAGNLSETYKFALLASQDLTTWVKDFINGGGAKNETLGTIKGNLAFAYERASLAQSSLQKVEESFRFFKQGNQLDKIKKYLPESREVLLKGQNLLGIMPEVLGFNGRRTYLVLFQNNAEIRPTGGFIGSFATVSLEKGQLLDFEVFDVYQADGQLKGHVEPPAKLKEYLGEASWYMRDSNWDPDFSVSAQRAQWFLDKEMQVTVDGTIAVTLEAARKAVAAFGEVAVPEYQEKINKDNLFQKAEYYAELATFPGSTQKKDFLGSLAQSLFEKIKNSQGKEIMQLGGSLFAGLEEKEIMAYFDKTEVETVFDSLNWSGKIRDHKPVSSKQPIFADFLLINEANVGINKANYFVQRKIDHLITVSSEGKVEEKLTITYDNQSPAETWPAGIYKNYLRLFLPKGARITSVLTSDSQNPDHWLPYDFTNFESVEDHGKSLFGFLFKIPIKTKQVVEIKYELDEKVDLSPKINSYLLLLQKQSGAYPSDYNLSFVYPAGYVPLRVIPSAVTGEGQLLIKGKLDRDLIFQIDLAH